jgi:hypothetical protein
MEHVAVLINLNHLSGDLVVILTDYQDLPWVTLHDLVTTEHLTAARTWLPEIALEVGVELVPASMT